jgi:hypothetical protein
VANKYDDRQGMLNKVIIHNQIMYKISCKVVIIVLCKL